jgi:hypothetical protein
MHQYQRTCTPTTGQYHISFFAQGLSLLGGNWTLSQFQAMANTYLKCVGGAGGSTRVGFGNILTRVLFTPCPLQ